MESPNAIMPYSKGHMWRAHLPLWGC